MSWIVTAVVVASSAGSAMIAKNQAAKAKSGQKTAENIMQGREQGQKDIVQSESDIMKEAGRTARSQMLAAGKRTPQEEARLARYGGKAQTPGESLMTESGPIAQAVARRVQERVDQPGMDYDTNSAALEQNVGQPIWRALKQRGIAPPPGSEGGGLGTQQYLSGVYPQLASLRTGQINTDISRGQEYGKSAQDLQNYYTDLENLLSEALQGREYQSGIYGAEAEQKGVTMGAEEKVSGSQDAMYKSGLNDYYKAKYEEMIANKNANDAAMMESYNRMTSAVAGGFGGGGGSSLASALNSGSSYKPAGGVSSSAIPANSRYSTGSSDLSSLLQKRLYSR